MNSTPSFRAGFLGLIGQPNAGKSTLLNRLVAEKVSIVTPKPQTTRRRVLGILNAPAYQVIVVDAPGIVKASPGLNTFLEKEAQDVIRESDALVAVLNLDEDKKENLDRILELVTASGKPWLALITKVDLADKIHRRERLRKELQEKYPKAPILEFSRTWQQDGEEFCEQFAKTAADLMPESPAPLYDPELYTPHTLRELAAEMIREKCLELLHQEVPYQLAVRITKFEEESGPVVRIFAEIIVSKENHKPIVIGKGGTLIKSIGTQARRALEELLERKVFLQLDVIVRESWFENPRLMKEFGYVVADE